MARLTGPDESCRMFVITAGPQKGKAYAAPGTPVPLYSDAQCSIPADVLTLDDEPVPGDPTPTVLISDTYQVPLFQYPDNVDVVYTRVLGGPVVPLSANADERIDALGARIGAAEAGTAEAVQVEAQARTAAVETLDTALTGKVGKGDLAVSARDYHAVGDGAADDTAAIVSAAAAAVSGGLREIYLPPGTYKHTGLNLAVSLRGAGRSRTTLRGPQITMNTVNTAMADLKVVSSSATAVFSANTQRVRLTNVEIDHEVGVTGHLAWDAYNVDQMQVTGCKFNIGGLQLALCDDFYIAGNFWDCQYANTNEPCHISAQSSGVFTGNTVTNTNTDCVDLYSSGHRCVISNNRFIGLRGASGLECKVTMSDNAGNTAGPGNVLEATVIANNVFRDFNSTTAGTRMGIFASFVDNRSVKAFSVAETNRAVLITGNVLEDFNATDPGNGATVNYQAIAFAGHNGMITNNVIRNVRAWNSATAEGISLTKEAVEVTDGQKCVGVTVAGNTIVGVENGYGIRAGTLDDCSIRGNVIRGDDVNGTVVRFGVDFVAGAQVSYTTISDNLFHCNYSTGMGLRASSGAILNHCVVNGNTFRDCGVLLLEVQDCTFVGNSLNNVTNSQVFWINAGATLSRGNAFVGNHITMNAAYGLLLSNVDGFVIDGNAFRGCQRGILFSGTVRNGLVAGNVSIGQTGGLEFPHYSGVSAADQATITVGLNRVSNSGGATWATSARRRTTVADTNYVVLNSDALVSYTSLTAARAVTLPAQGASLPAGQEFTIKDESGSADGTKTITVTPTAGTIDGAANTVINTAYGSVTVFTNGTNWFRR